MKKKILSNDPMEQEYQAKIVAVSEAMANFYRQAMNAIVHHSEMGRPEEDIPMLLDKLSIDWATRVVDDISPKENIIHG